VGRHLSIRNNTKLRLNLCGRNNTIENNCPERGILFQLSHLDLKAELSILNPDEHGTTDSKKSSKSGNLFSEKKWGFDPDVLNLGKDIVLEGYFQSEKYFSAIKDIIREDLSISLKTEETLFNEYKDEILATNSVSIHIRRGDYLNLDTHYICSLNYYSRSVEFLQNQLNNLHFFIFSDDIKWCSEHFSPKVCHHVDIEESEINPLIDLKLMSLCKHHIITNSSFSWWAAWLNNKANKIVVSPDRWFSTEAALRWKVGRDPILDDWKTIEP